MNELVFKKGTVLIFFLVMFLSTSKVLKAQITIKEEIKIQSRNTEIVTNSEKLKLAEAGEFYYPVLRDIGFGRYLILKSGNLNLLFTNAQTYNVDGAENNVINYSIKSSNTARSSSVSLYDIMGTPIAIRELANKGGSSISCRESKKYFTSALNYGIGAYEDTWIEMGRPENNYGSENILLSYGLFDEAKPDSAGGSTFLKFGIGETVTNATLSSASLVIQADSNNTDPTGSYNIYRAGGLWDELSLTYNTRPSADTLDIILVTENDIVENDIKYIYETNVTSFVSEWLNGAKSDYGFELVSRNGHFFASSESFLTASPTVNITLQNQAELGTGVLNLNAVQAGDTLEIEFPGLSKDLAANFETNSAGIEADDQLIFFKRGDCLNDRIRALPYINGTTENRYFEFVSNLNLTIPVDTVGTIYEEYFEPKLLYDNTSVQAPDIFNQYFMELYDTPFIDYPDGSSFPLANFFDPEEFEYPSLINLNRDTRGGILQVDNDASNEGRSFKIRIAGWMVKGLSSGKVASAQPENEILAMLMDMGNNVVVSNVSDPNCGFPTDVIAENVFTTCFEFTIGGENRLLVEAEPDSIFPGGTSVLTAKLLTAQGDTVDFPPDQVFEVSIDEEFRSLGTLLSATNDTADVITNNAPEFAFLSDTSAEESRTVGITVITAYEGEVLRGSKSIELLPPYELNIVLDNEAEVRPTLRARDGGNAENSNIEEFEVTVLDNGIGIPNHEVELVLRLIPSSGGHDHVTAPPVNRLGTLLDQETNQFGIGTLTTQTNQEGVIRIQYTATEIGGDLEVKARSTTQINTVLDTLSVKVPDLEYLGISPFYELVGAPQNHSGTNDPCRSPESLTSEHFLGHYGTQELRDEIEELSRSFFANNDSTQLRINDMSLINGGIFDTGNNWTNPHNGHRTGNQADIGLNTIDKMGNCVDDADIVVQYIIGRTFIQTIAYNTHYHVRI